MARKNLLEGLMGASAAAPSDRETANPRYAKGAIGAISRSVADLQARALAEIDPFLIDAGGLQDRLESDDHEDRALRQSIEDYGQQVPVLVRPHPDQEGRYQIVYGRRRVLALRDLGRPVKALVRQLDDRDLVIAQGQENTARRDLSFIEKANFARQMLAAGYDRKIVGDTLSMDKTLISRLISVADRVPEAIIEVIGAAPSVGRDRWLSLADAIEAAEIPTPEMVSMINLLGGATSDARFDAALSYAKGLLQKAKTPVAAEVITTADGAALADVTRKGGHVNIRFRKGRSKGFDDWLVASLSELHHRWSEDQDK